MRSDCGGGGAAGAKDDEWLRGGVLCCVFVGVVGWMIEYRAKRHDGGNEASLFEAKFCFQSVACAFPNMHITPHTLTQACAWVVWGAPHLLPRSVRQQLFPLCSWDTQSNARRGTEEVDPPLDMPLH